MIYFRYYLCFIPFILCFRHSKQNVKMRFYIANIFLKIFWTILRAIFLIVPVFLWRRIQTQVFVVFIFTKFLLSWRILRIWHFFQEQNPNFFHFWIIFAEHLVPYPVVWVCTHLPKIKYFKKNFKNVKMLLFIKKFCWFTHN